MRLRRVRLVSMLPELGPSQSLVVSRMVPTKNAHRRSFALVEFGEEMAQTYDAGPVS